MNIEALQIEDAAAICADVSLGFAEPFRHVVYAQLHYGIFLDSFEEGEPADGVTPLLVSKETFTARDMQIGELIYRPDNLLLNEQVYEIEGYKPEPGGVVRLLLGPSNRLFSLPF